MSPSEPPENQAHASGYLAFLIRMWKDHGASSWRASLENPHTGERASFAELRLLFQYLDNLTSDTGDPSATTRPGESSSAPRRRRADASQDETAEFDSGKMGGSDV